MRNAHQHRASHPIVSGITRRIRACFNSIQIHRFSEITIFAVPLPICLPTEHSRSSTCRESAEVHTLKCVQWQRHRNASQWQLKCAKKNFFFFSLHFTLLTLTQSVQCCCGAHIVIVDNVSATMAAMQTLLASTRRIRNERDIERDRTCSGTKWWNICQKSSAEDYVESFYLLCDFVTLNLKLLLLSAFGRFGVPVVGLFSSEKYI